ncbi:hypothetical protein LTR85_010924 [Meristemomyces frigidus]|nr:hypothetical protein LTR85_010924 [Meristemomyces frigidus]
MTIPKARAPLAKPQKVTKSKTTSKSGKGSKVKTSSYSDWPESVPSFAGHYDARNGSLEKYLSKRRKATLRSSKSAGLVGGLPAGVRI